MGIMIVDGLFVISVVLSVRHVLLLMYSVIVVMLSSLEYSLIMSVCVSLDIMRYIRISVRFVIISVRLVSIVGISVYHV